MNKIRLMLLNIYTIFSYDVSIITIYKEARNKYHLFNQIRFKIYLLYFLCHY